MTPSELAYIRTTVLKTSQKKLAKEMGYKSGSAILAMEKQGAKVPGYFENHLKLLVETKGHLWLIND